MDLLDAGDFAGALASAGLASPMLAEIEERWGDSLFFAEEAGAAEHFQKARAALFPPGIQLDGEENARRMEAHQRLTEKLYAIDPYGKPRQGHECRPHPRTKMPRTELPQPPAPDRSSIEERRAAVVHARESRLKNETPFAQHFRDAGWWAHAGLAQKWRAAGEALASSYPAAARRAFEWSLHYWELYNKAWTEHLPVSRWDSDGGWEMSEVQGMLDALPEGAEDPALQAWADALLSGEWDPGAASPADEWAALAALLKEDS